MGAPCSDDARCKGPCAGGDNVCSIGFFTDGDLFGDPVCVSTCTRGFGQTFQDVLCDGDELAAPGVCEAPGPGDPGVCLPICDFDATTIRTSCAGSNKCTSKYFATTSAGGVFSIGACVGACAVDGDCKGTPGSKCQSETGFCVRPEKHVVMTKLSGDSCDGTLAECNCTTVGGAGPNKDRGYCSRVCLTGPAGNAACDAAAAGWTCSASLPATFTDGKPAFASQPDGVLGRCEKPCAVDADCDALAATVGNGVTMTCVSYADGKHCRSSVL